MVRGENHKYKQAQKKSEKMGIRDIVRCSKNTNRQLFFVPARRGVSAYNALMAMRNGDGAHTCSVDNTR